MKKTKKLISSILLIFAIANLGTWAEETPVAISEDATVISDSAATDGIVIECGEASHLTSYGEIIEDGDGFIVVETYSGQKLQFNYDDSTYMIDADGVSAFDIAGRTSDKVIVSHDTAMTRSIPAQTFAYAIVGNVKEDLGNPVYTEVESVEKTEDGIIITTDNGSLLIHVSADAKVTPFLTKNIVRLEDVTAGSKVLLWYDAVMQSLPAQAASERVVILANNDSQNSGILLPENSVLINGTTIILNDGEAAYDSDGVRMLPLRTVAEKLGYTVDWNADEVSVLLQKDDMVIKVYVNEVNDEYYSSNVSGRAINTYPKAVLNGSKTYVEEGFFASL